MGFDEDCRLHYEIAVSGLQNEEHHAYAQMGYYNAGSAQVSRILDAFRGNLVIFRFFYFFIQISDRGFGRGIEVVGKVYSGPEWSAN